MRRSVLERNSEHGPMPRPPSWRTAGKLTASPVADNQVINTEPTPTMQRRSQHGALGIRRDHRKYLQRIFADLSATLGDRLIMRAKLTRRARCQPSSASVTRMG